MVTPDAAVAAEIASTPWIEAFVAPSVLRSAEVEVRLMVSVPAPRLIVPAPIMIASSCAPVSVIVSLPLVPVRFPVVTLLTVGVGCGRNVPARHHVQDVGSAAKIDRAEARPLVGGHRDRVVTAAASQRFDVADRASREIDCRRVGENNRVRISATVNRLARGKVAIGEVERVVASTTAQRVRARATEDAVCGRSSSERITTAEAIHRIGRGWVGRSGRIVSART